MILEVVVEVGLARELLHEGWRELLVLARGPILGLLLWLVGASVVVDVFHGGLWRIRIKVIRVVRA